MLAVRTIPEPVDRIGPRIGPIFLHIGRIGMAASTEGGHLGRRVDFAESNLSRVCRTQVGRRRITAVTILTPQPFLPVNVPCHSFC
jgi:hypothetical protein